MIDFLLPSTCDEERHVPAVRHASRHDPAVAVEVLLLRLDGAGRLAYRELRAGWWPPGTPDALALRFAGIDGSAPDATVSHSTSWRCDRNGRIVLTYAVLPDPDP